MKKLLVAYLYKDSIKDFMGYHKHLTHIKKLSVLYSHLKYLKHYYKKRSKLKIKNKKKFQLTSDIKKIDLEKNIIFCIKNRTNSINSPSITKQKKHYKKLYGNTPDIEVYLLKNCSSYGRSSCISGNYKAYSNTLYHSEVGVHDLKNPILYQFNSYSKKEITLYFKEDSFIKKSNVTFIHLLNEHSGNYFHWLYEITPKILLLNKLVKKNEEYCLLIDKGIPQQFFTIIDLCIEFPYKLHKVSHFERFTCSKLIYCTDLWTSLDNTKNISDIQKDFFVDQYAVRLVRSRIIKDQQKKPSRKIYLDRKKGRLRHLLNNSDVTSYLTLNGFEILYPEEHCFKQQVDIFSNARIIIGVSGAAFSNLVFMQENTHAIIFSPDTVGANYYIFQPLADVAKVNLTHILTKRREETPSVHSSATIDISQIKELLETIDKENRN